MQIGTVSSLWRYPASSLAGEPMQQLELTQTGAIGDRGFGLFDTASGEIARPDGDKKWHKVPRIRTRLLDDGGLEVATPGDDWVPATGDEASRRLSDYLGFSAAIFPFNPATEIAGHRIGSRYGVAPVHLLTTASLARLRALHPAGDPDPRRFRPNILVDMLEVEGSFPETEWIGRRLAIGASS